MKSPLFAACIVASLLAGIFAAPASAGTVSTSSQTFTQDFATLVWQGNDFSQEVVFPQFDPNLGVLTSVDITLTGTVLGTLTAQGGAGKTVTAQASTNMTLLAKDDPSGLFTPSLADVAPTAKFRIPLPINGNRVASGSETMCIAVNLQNQLDRFTGKDFFRMLLNGIRNDSITLPAGATANLANQSSASVSLTYNYTQVPEPTTFAGLAALGLTGAAVCFVRKRRS